VPFLLSIMPIDNLVLWVFFAVFCGKETNEIEIGDWDWMTLMISTQSDVVLTYLGGLVSRVLANSTTFLYNNFFLVLLCSHVWQSLKSSRKEEGKTQVPQAVELSEYPKVYWKHSETQKKEYTMSPAPKKMLLKHVRYNS